MKNCGNPFKALFPKKNDACICPQVLSLLNDFETSLTVSIAELVPKGDDGKDFITVSWMIQAMHSLCETHQSFTTLVTNLELPASDMEQSLIFMHCDISAKLLQLCTAFESELDRLNHGNMLLKFAFGKPEEFSLSHLDRWRQHMASKNPRIENCGEVLSSLVESMNHHHSLYKKVKKTKENEKEKVLLRALYGAQVETLYIFSVFDAAFTGSSKNLLYLTIPKDMEEVPWGQAFMELENMINMEIKNTFLSDRFMVIKDLEAVESGVEKLYAEVQERSVVPNLLMVEQLNQSVMELSEMIDLVFKEMSCLFDALTSARDALFDKLRNKLEDKLAGSK
ncbi:unnamed protein product [Eruca vesicaria subsp. sativa]|uniref:Protein BPS1, chloroplastic-like n=1 Tax=Eruca vesicaria subsp. sativa TaxID=29727 RepID=A0ABC8JM53_ERUVS|nr:unnamed protein product [Eruca vesicaria subsp. sativa]